MKDLLKKFFGANQAPDSKSEEQDGDHDIRVATCALFLEMAKIDGEFSEGEQSHIVSILKSEHQLSDEHVDDLIEAATEELRESIDLWRFARRINDYYSEEEKIRIVEMMWRIVFVDGILDRHEDYLIRKLSRLLRIPHRIFIETKVRMVKEED
jgi:uncharacterized tellurite resistance protein B-like protein